MQAPLFCNILKLQVTIILKSIVGHLNNRDFIDDILLFYKAGCHASKSNKIMISYVAGITVGNDQIVITIIVEVSNRRIPAPIGFSGACIETNVTKNRRTY